MLPNAEDVEADLVGERDLLQEVAQPLLGADLFGREFREGVDTKSIPQAYQLLVYSSFLQQDAFRPTRTGTDKRTAEISRTTRPHSEAECTSGTTIDVRSLLPPPR